MTFERIDLKRGECATKCAMELHWWCRSNRLDIASRTLAISVPMVYYFCVGKIFISITDWTVFVFGMNTWNERLWMNSIFITLKLENSSCCFILFLFNVIVICWRKIVEIFDGINFVKQPSDEEDWARKWIWGSLGVGIHQFGGDDNKMSKICKSSEWEIMCWSDRWWCRSFSWIFVSVAFNLFCDIRGVSANMISLYLRWPSSITLKYWGIPIPSAILGSDIDAWGMCRWMKLRHLGEQGRSARSLASGLRSCGEVFDEMMRLQRWYIGCRSRNWR